MNPSTDPPLSPDELDAQLREALSFLGHNAREGHSSTLALLELQRIRPDPMSLVELSDRIDRNARRSLAAIDDFMDLARARTTALSLEELDLADLLVELVADAWSLASRHGIRVQLDSGPETAPLHADRELLASAIAKLLRDAAARAPRGVDVLCALTEGPDDWIVAIDDPGAPDARQAATEASPWDRKRAPEERAGPGLALAQVVAKRHSGRIDIEPGSGVGHVVRWHLPRR